MDIGLGGVRGGVVRPSLAAGPSGRQSECFNKTF